ncbi:MAG: hypothetical protein JO111_11715 [Caulobacteraceae bacterium]|nr:hypothetical protein [Caulobacteraceae bacterium]
MSIIGGDASAFVVADGAEPCPLVRASGGETVESVSQVGAAATAGVSVIGWTPSGEGQPVILLVDAARDALEIDSAGDPLLIEAGVTWTGRSASEDV